MPSISPLPPPLTQPSRIEVRVIILGALSIAYGVILGGLSSLMVLVWLSRGFHGNLFDLGTGLMVILAIASVGKIPSGIGLLLHHAWAIRLTYGICAALLICSSLGMALNLCLDNEVVAIPIIPFLWSIALNFVLRSSKLAKSLRDKRA